MRKKHFHLICTTVFSKGFGCSEVDLSSFPLGETGAVIELALRSVKDGAMVDFNKTQRKFIKFLSGFEGVQQSNEYQ